MKEKQQSTDQNSYNDSEEEKTETERSYLPPLTPSVQSVKSTNAPSIVPRKALSKNSNKKMIRNAI